MNSNTATNIINIIIPWINYMYVIKGSKYTCVNLLLFPTEIPKKIYPAHFQLKSILGVRSQNIYLFLSFIMI